MSLFHNFFSSLIANIVVKKCEGALELPEDLSIMFIGPWSILHKRPSRANLLLIALYITHGHVNLHNTLLFYLATLLSVIGYRALLNPCIYHLESKFLVHVWIVWGINTFLSILLNNIHTFFMYLSGIDIRMLVSIFWYLPDYIVFENFKISQTKKLFSQNLESLIEVTWSRHLETITDYRIYAF